MADESPLQLVRLAGDRLELNTAALDYLRRLKGPTAVVSIVGRARTGKSYLLNRLLGRRSPGGFTTGNTTRPCTRGLWLSAVKKAVPGSGGEVNLVLIDTEGSDAYNQTCQDGVRVFALALLLSSVFIYNQSGAIDEASIDRLSLIAEVGKRIRVRASADDAGGGSSLEELGRYRWVRALAVYLLALLLPTDAIQNSAAVSCKHPGGFDGSLAAAGP